MHEIVLLLVRHVLESVIAADTDELGSVVDDRTFDLVGLVEGFAVDGHFGERRVLHFAAYATGVSGDDGTVRGPVADHLHLGFGGVVTDGADVLGLVG